MVGGEMADNLDAALNDARGKLGEYINVLWDGRAQAAQSLVAVYTERLAAAARLSVLLARGRSIAAALQLIQKEHDEFPRDFLASEGGRGARSAFNLLMRDVVALSNMTLPKQTIADGPEILVGESLSAVSFVQDYVRLEFNGPCLQVICPLVLVVDGKRLQQEEAGFRDCLCAAIEQVVGSVRVDGDRLVMQIGHLLLECIFNVGKRGYEPLIFSTPDTLMSMYVGAE